jgi:hypothetical protein
MTFYHIASGDEGHSDDFKTLHQVQAMLRQLCGLELSRETLRAIATEG